MDTLSNQQIKNLNKFIQKESFYDQQPFLQRCQQHPQYHIQYICTDTSNECAFKCACCVVENLIQPNKLILINEVIEGDQKTIFPNWPIYDDQSFSKKVKEISQKQPNSVEQKEKINSYFKDLIAKILLKIEQMKQKMLEKADNLWDLNKKIVELYNTLSEKTQIKQIIMDDQLNAEQKNKNLKKIFLHVNSNLDQNKQSILSQLSYLEDLEKQINYQQPQLIKDQVLLLLDNINFITTDSLDIFFEQQNQIVSNLNQENDNVSQIMGVLSNKINNCSETFVKNVQQQLNRYSSILNKLNLGRMYQNEEQIPPNFNNLTQDQLKELYYISNQYLKFNNSELSQQQQNKLKKVAIFQQIVNNSKIICPSLLSDIKNILTRVSCYLNSFTYQEFLIFKQTNFQQSNQLKVTLNQNQQSSIYLAQNISGNIVFSKVINTKVYIFRFLLNQNFYIHNGYLRIGIQLFDKIDTEVINDCKKYGFSSQKDFKHKIVKGNSLNSEDVSKTYQELEFRFCLSKKLFYFSDYPNYNSVNMIEKDLISENDLYGFGVSIQNLGLDLNLTNTYFQLQDYQNDQQVTKFQ